MAEKTDSSISHTQFHLKPYPTFFLLYRMAPNPIISPTALIYRHFSMVSASFSSVDAHPVHQQRSEIQICQELAKIQEYAGEQKWANSMLSSYTQMINSGI